MGRILGIDWGERRVGVALSDPLGITAQPLAFLPGGNEGDLLDALARLVEEREVERVVVGVPLHMSGARGARARKTEAFMARLAKRLSVPVEGWDERLSTAAAERSLREMGLSGKKRRRKLDVASAQLILQGYLDRQRGAGR